ncbi:GNAT family N-acetyltransferase [Agrococcus beijingensis]|uniref:GNAT family N-acetyltransferase n=1 Tax=Agrococcus beijingensis TaxID=3068634 RepID=UPI0027423634|nr:GNAT family N-acetyltransferase [Agrococcus sp. REN33]
MELRSPASVDEAIAWLRSATSTIDTAANRALLSAGSLERTFASGKRRPELVWAATEASRVLGLIAARDYGDARLIDVLALATDAAWAPSIVAEATAWAAESAEAELSFGAPAQAPLDDPQVRALLALVEAAGWRMLVTRRHYELPAGALTSRATPDLVLERAREGDEDRLAALLEHVVAGSRDARDAAAVAEVGAERAARKLALDLLDADPIDCIRFAVDDGRDVGMVSWLTVPSGYGFLLRVGVAERARGRGLGRDLVAAATADLLASGAHTLIADTDDANAPMRRAFDAEGWSATEARIDLHLP